MKLLDVYETPGAIDVLWQLLGERTPAQSISHKAMPTFEQHAAFVASRPYLAWHLIDHESLTAGACYLTHQREIGIFLFKSHQMRGLGALAVSVLIDRYPGRFLANVAPSNPGSAEFFRNLGFRHIQNTFALEP